MTLWPTGNTGIALEGTDLGNVAVTRCEKGGMCLSRIANS